MKSFSDAAMEEIEAGTAIVSGAVEIACDPPIRVWGGFGTLTIEGADYQGLGDHGLAQTSAAAVGGAEQNVTLTLSGIAPEAVELIDADEVRGAAVTIRRLIFKGDGKTFLDSHVFTRGRLDKLTIADTIGGAATIAALVESAARGLGLRGGRMRSDADQRLVKANDGFFKHVSFAAEKTLSWGGKKPATAGAALGGVPPTSNAQRFAAAGFNLIERLR